MSTIHPDRLWLTATVVVHLGLSIAHGAAHAGAQVPLSLASNLFVVVVILAGPVCGLVVSWRRPRLGAWMVAATMAASLVFGAVNHFIVEGADHVAHIVPRWRMLFGSTAVLLSVAESLGGAIAVHVARSRTWA